MKEINLKAGNPPCDVAVACMHTEIESAIFEGLRVIKFIHGYGSNGIGGTIKKECESTLKILTQQKKILGFITGETLSSNHSLYPLLLELCPDIIIDTDFRFKNAGVTVVILNNKT